MAQWQYLASLQSLKAGPLTPVCPPGLRQSTYFGQSLVPLPLISSARQPAKEWGLQQGGGRPSWQRHAHTERIFCSRERCGMLIGLRCRNTTANLSPGVSPSTAIPALGRGWCGGAVAWALGRGLCAAGAALLQTVGSHRGRTDKRAVGSRLGAVEELEANFPGGRGKEGRHTGGNGDVLDAGWDGGGTRELQDEEVELQGGEGLEEEEEGVEVSEEEYAKEARRAVVEYEKLLRAEDPEVEEEVVAEEEPAEGRRKGKRRRGKQQMEWQIPDDLLPCVAIVGRPNVGKSALFNRVAGGDVAIVHNEPGVTRDRLYRRSFWGGREFMVVDTGGVVTVPGSESVGTDATSVTSGGGAVALKLAAAEAAAAGLPTMIERQAAAAVDSAAVIVFVVDGKDGLTSADRDIASWLRREHADKPLVLAVNKCDTPFNGALASAEFWELGAWEPLPVSAISGTGSGELMDMIVEGLPSQEEMASSGEDGERRLRLAIVGRPNVGKSSLLNSLVGEERTIVSPISGTTRDAIDTDFTGPDGKLYQLVDTAGIRRRTRVASAGSRAEALSVQRAFRAIRRADVVALVLQAMDGVVEQDMKLADRIEAEGRACVVVINKWDTVQSKTSNTLRDWETAVRGHLPSVAWAPILFVSATTGQRVPRLLKAARDVGEQHSRRVTTATLNGVVQEAVALKSPPRGKGGKRGRIYYCTQAAVRPPTFVFFVNNAELFDRGYKRFMENQIRANVGLPGTPIRLLWRTKSRDNSRSRKARE